MSRPALRRALILAENLDNVGDLALLLQLVHGLRDRLGITEIYVRQWQLPASETMCFMEEQGLSVVAGKSIKGLLNWRTLLIYGGGQVVRDQSSRASMLAMRMTIFFSFLGQCRRAALAIGVSPLKSRFHKGAWSSILSAFSPITVRDAVSLERANELLEQKVKTELTADLAFLPSPLHKALLVNTARKTIIIAPCDDAREGRTLDLDAVAGMAFDLASLRNVWHFTLIAHDTRPEMDGAVCEALADILRAKGDMHIEIVATASLDACLTHYRNAAAVLTNRLHAMIFAMLGHKPVLIINDRNDKLAAAAERFSVSKLDQNATENQSVINNELAGVYLPERNTALQHASEQAERNFTFLEESLKT
tara:strand:- start:138 stop:1232 length:1095 start_codon:yes stop_codon:yes gene_type:complete